MIEHIVLAAGAYKGLYIIGALNHLASIDFYNIENIKTIYGGSVGGLIGAMLCLKIEWEIMLKYIIDRPWHKSVSFNSDTIFSFITDKGLFDESLFKIFFKNLLESKNLSIDITLLQLFEYSNIELHLHTVDINTLSVKKLSYKTEPNMKLIDAIYSSCAIPFVFKPKKLGDSLYIDGGVKNDYPINYCIEDGYDSDKILGIIIKDDKHEAQQITENDNLFAYSFYFLMSLISEFRTKDKPKIKNQIIIPTQKSNIQVAIDIFNDKNERKKFIDLGVRYAKLFLEYVPKNNV